jgi:hypothetical protein
MLCGREARRRGAFFIFNRVSVHWHRILLSRWHVIFAFAAGMVAGTAEHSFAFNYDALGVMNADAVATAMARALTGFSGHWRILARDTWRRGGAPGV